MKRNAGSPGNQVSMVEVSIGANMKIATAENAVRQIYPNKWKSEKKAYSSSGHPTLDPPKQAGHSCRKNRVHYTRSGSPFSSGDVSRLTPVSVLREITSFSCWSVWSDTVSASSTFFSTRTWRPSNHCAAYPKPWWKGSRIFLPCEIRIELSDKDATLWFSYLVVEEVESTPCIKGIESSCHGIDSVTRSFEKGHIEVQQVDWDCHARLLWRGGKESISYKNLAHWVAGTCVDIDGLEI